MGLIKLFLLVLLSWFAIMVLLVIVLRCIEPVLARLGVKLP